MSSTSFDLTRIYKKHPLLSQFSSSLPSNIKDLFAWMEFVVSNNAIANAGIKKLSETPITSFKYYASDDIEEGASSNQDSWKSIIEDTLDLKAKLVSISHNTLLYGNTFVSVYDPINRFLICDVCKSRVNIRNSRKLKVFLKKPNRETSVSEESYTDSNSKDYSKRLGGKVKKTTRVSFSCWCETCHGSRTHSATDYKSKSKEDINIIMWNPHQIEISSNQISGETEYYYKIPPELKESIKKADKLSISTIPIPMIEAALLNKMFKFEKNAIMHAKREIISGVSTAWGMPALTAAIPSFFTLMILRKANEKIASDYMVPLRVMYPAQTSSGAGELYNFMGGSDFVGKINSMLEKWKLDPSAVQTTPFPLGTETVLGDGKMLSLNAEIEQLESNIANSLGIPIEFIKGGLSYTTQGSSLRLLENQLANISAGLDNIIEFIVKKISVILDKEPIKISMVPFKIVDDLAEKSAIIQLAMSGPDKISAGTLFELFNLDAVTEQKRIESETKNGIRKQIELSQYQTEVASDIEQRARSAAQMANNSFTNINQQALMQEAQMYVEQLMQMDDGARKSQLDEMSKTNYIMYSTVKALLEMQKGKDIYAAGKEAVDGGQSGGQDGASQQ